MTFVKTCKIHGNLTLDQTRLNRISPTGKRYLRCGICRNEQARQRLSTKYLVTPKKHEKYKLPSWIKPENKAHAYTVLNRFKVTAHEYYEMLEKQKNLCAICFNPETQISKKYKRIKMLCVDHCHKTGKIRGLLCHKCNVGLGAFRDSIENLNAAIQYLKLI